MKPTNLAMREYEHRLAVLLEGGYRVQSDQREDNLWVALLVHHNGERVRLQCHPKWNAIFQITNPETNDVGL